MACGAAPKAAGCPPLAVGSGGVLTGGGVAARTCPKVGMAAARCEAAGTSPWKALPSAVDPGGATIVTLVMLVTLRTLLTFVVLFTVLLMTVWLICVVLFWMRMPMLVTGGALTTTAGGVPIGAGTMRPGRDPGGDGTNTPIGPTGRVPPPIETWIERCSPGGGGTKATPRAAQKPETNTTAPSRCS